LPLEDIVGCEDKDPALTNAIEQCVKAAARCQTGEITLQNLYETYCKLIPSFCFYDMYGAWAKLIVRANRIAQMTGSPTICELC